MNKQKKIRSAMWIVLSISLLSVLISSFDAQKRNFELSKNLDVFYSLFRELDLYYVDSIDAEQTIRIAIDTMLASLDPYTEYIPEADMADFRVISTGEYGGVGALIRARNGEIIVAEPYEGKPAQKAGLRAGDIILSIDGEDMTDKSVAYVSDKLKGKAGSELKLMIKREGEKKSIEFRIIREKIQIDPVSYFTPLDHGVGYVQINTFNDKTTQQLKNAFLTLKTKHNISSLIIDLRNNGGGVMEEAVRSVNLFVSKGNTILSTKGKVRQWDKTYKATIHPIDSVIPIAILVNGNSASSSEILAGAIQDLDRGVIIGERTFGKGLVQSTRELPYNGSLKLTIAKYYTPSGRCVQSLDYSRHRKESNKNNEIKQQTFYTLNGRPVNDGGGISPDILINTPELPNILFYLVMEDVVFDYANQFFLQNPVVPRASNFTISDDQYNHFKEFVKSEKFTYDRQSERILTSLKEVAKFEGYFDDAQLEFEALEKKLTHDTNKSLDIFRKEISKYLSIEILKRYYYQNGAIEYQLLSDLEVQKAIEILTDNKQYTNILHERKK